MTREGEEQNGNTEERPDRPFPRGTRCVEESCLALTASEKYKKEGFSWFEANKACRQNLGIEWRVACPTEAQDDTISKMAGDIVTWTGFVEDGDWWDCVIVDTDGDIEKEDVGRKDDCVVLSKPGGGMYDAKRCGRKATHVLCSTPNPNYEYDEVSGEGPPPGSVDGLEVSGLKEGRPAGPRPSRNKSGGRSDIMYGAAASAGIAMIAGLMVASFFRKKRREEQTAAVVADMTELKTLG